MSCFLSQDKVSVLYSYVQKCQHEGDGGVCCGRVGGGGAGMGRGMCVCVGEGRGAMKK